MMSMVSENVKEVEVSAVNGKVELEGWESDHVEVDYIIHGEFEVKVSTVNGNVVVGRV